MILFQGTKVFNNFLQNEICLETLGTPPIYVILSGYIENIYNIEQHMYIIENYYLVDLNKTELQLRITKII